MVERAIYLAIPIEDMEPTIPKTRSEICEEANNELEAVFKPTNSYIVEPYGLTFIVLRNTESKMLTHIYSYALAGLNIAVNLPFL